MLYSAKDLDGFDLAARDGTLGRAREVYFDDRHWVIRHVVVDTGGWLTGRSVLVSPHSIARLDVDTSRLELTLTREQVRNAPDIDTDKPVSRQQEAAYYDYYGYPHYWAGSGLWGAGALPLAAGGTPPSEEAARAMQEAAQAEREASDPHLRSSKEVAGYDAQATDGEIGHIEDFLFDDRSWQILHVVVDTRDWLPGRKVLVSPQSIADIDWHERRVRFNVSRAAIEASPPYHRDHRRGLAEEEHRRMQRHFEGYV